MKYYSVIKKNELSSHENTGMNLKCVWLSKRSQSERCMTIWLQLCGILEKEKWWKQWEGDLCQGLEGGVYRWSIGDFGGSELYLYGMIMVDVGHHTFFGFTECTAPRVTLNVNCGLWLIMMRQCHFISFATLAWCYWWDRVVWNSLYSLLSLTVKLKLV